MEPDIDNLAPTLRHFTAVPDLLSALHRLSQVRSPVEDRFPHEPTKHLEESIANLRTAPANLREQLGDVKRV